MIVFISMQQSLVQKQPPAMGGRFLAYALLIIKIFLLLHIGAGTKISPVIRRHSIAKAQSWCKRLHVGKSAITAGIKSSGWFYLNLPMNNTEECCTKSLLFFSNIGGAKH